MNAVSNPSHLGPVSQTIEDYLRTILLIQTHGSTPTLQRLRKFRRVSTATVWATLNRMERAGLVFRDDARHIVLSDEGIISARLITRRHRLAERFLADVLHVPFAKLYLEADQMEHAISPSLEQRMERLLGQPTTCPHGNPIDEVFGEDREDFALGSFGSGQVMITRILEIAALDGDLMEWLATRQLLPGRTFEVIATRGRHVELQDRDGTVRLPALVAGLLMALSSPAS